MPEFELACQQAEVPIGGRQLVEINDRLVIVFNVDGNFYCIDDVCTHDGGPLSEGVLQGCQIACPRHGAKFDVTSGQALSMPATKATGSHEVKLDNGSVYVKMKE